MKIVRPSVQLVDNVDGLEVLKKIERAGRICYKSEDKITDDSCKLFIANAIRRGHESLIEHVHITVKVICDRGVTHEIVRHRLANYSQESTRYCNYSKNKYGNEITVIEPFFYKDKKRSKERFIWETAMINATIGYMELIKNGSTPQEARSVLPNSLKTEIIITYNLREWRHFFRVRASKYAHPQMQEIAYALLKLLKSKISIVFDEFELYDGVIADIIL